MHAEIVDHYLIFPPPSPSIRIYKLIYDGKSHVRLTPEGKAALTPMAKYIAPSLRNKNDPLKKQPTVLCYRTVGVLFQVALIGLGKELFRNGTNRETEATRTTAPRRIARTDV